MNTLHNINTFNVTLHSILWSLLNELWGQSLHYFRFRFPGAGVPVSVAAGEVGGAAVLIVNLEDVSGEGSRACSSSRRVLFPLSKLASMTGK